MKEIIRVFLVDDHPVVRTGLRNMLATDSRIQVVGEASGGDEAVEWVCKLQPDVVLMDVRMPGMSGIQATHRIKKAVPNTSVIMLTMYNSEMYIIEGIRAGAAGYLTKDASRELLSHAIRAALDGGTMVRSELLRQAIQGLLRQRNRGGGSGDSSLLSNLTARELDVVRLLAEGQGNKSISAELDLADVTVKKHVQSIISKLGVSDRTQAALVAARLGAVELIDSRDPYVSASTR
jgi:DNA-binding NarL/FixJ family response regulator